MFICTIFQKSFKGLKAFSKVFPKKIYIQYYWPKYSNLGSDWSFPVKPKQSLLPILLHFYPWQTGKISHKNYEEILSKDGTCQFCILKKSKEASSWMSVIICNEQILWNFWIFAFLGLKISHSLNIQTVWQFAFTHFLLPLIK